MGQARIKQARNDFRATALAVSTKKANEPRQRQLPLPWHFLRPTTQSDFAHPAEEELARILSFYRIRWIYEPTSFVLEWSEDGRAIQSFTPDFYLPEHRLYIEVTTMRQPLVTRKNKKLRRLRELYPGVQIKLLYRRDVEQIFGSYRDDRVTRSLLRPGQIVANEDKLRIRIDELGNEISHWCDSLPSTPERSSPLLVLGCAPGALTFKHKLVQSLRSRGVLVEYDRVMTTRYRAAGGRNHIRVVRPPRGDIQGKDILLVTDVVSTGLSVRYLVDWLLRNGARRVEVCALLTRSRSRLIDLNVRFRGFEAPDGPIAGFGIGKTVSLRSLPNLVRLYDEVSDGIIEA